jgi:tRNA-2-methylthio-N6-dimethylallyladenosine synthase
MAEQTRITRELMRERVGVRETVLVEAVSKKNPEELLARTQRDEMLVFQGSVSLIGTFMEATLSSLRGSTFRATEVRPCILKA